MYDKKIQDKALAEGLKNYPKNNVGHKKTMFDQNAPIDGNEGKRVLFMHGYMESSQEYESLPKIHGWVYKFDCALALDFELSEVANILEDAGFKVGDKVELIVRKIKNSEDV